MRMTMGSLVIEMLVDLRGGSSSTELPSWYVSTLN
jgi:hypothetical protein